MVSRRLAADQAGAITDPWDVEQKNHGGVAGYALVPPYIWRSRHFSRRSMERNAMERLQVDSVLQCPSVKFFTKKRHAERWVHEHYESEQAGPYRQRMSKFWKENGWEWGYVPIRFAVVPHAISRSP